MQIIRIHRADIISVMQHSSFSPSHSRGSFPAETEEEASKIAADTIDIIFIFIIFVCIMRVAGERGHYYVFLCRKQLLLLHWNEKTHSTCKKLHICLPTMCVTHNNPAIKSSACVTNNHTLRVVTKSIMKVISVLVLASTASAFVPGSAPIRTWCVGYMYKYHAAR